MGKKFKDYFSTQATSYTQFRPVYPDALFEWLASLPANRGTAWDCATGNGQAAVGLSKYFDEVIATDASENQIAQASPQKKVDYRLARAENSGLEKHSADLITVAQAAHWFDHDAFADEATRVLRDDGVIALWGYELQRVSPEIDSVIDYLYEKILGQYWPPERRHIETAYHDIPFPFRKIDAPEFSLQVQWSADQQLGYFRTWSSTERYKKSMGSDPVELIEDQLRAVWGEQSRRVSWPLFMKVGRAVNS